MITFALEALYDAVVASFAADGLKVPNYFGWRQPAQQTTGNRIIWVPGDDKSAIVGEYRTAREPGRNPRPLADLGEYFTVYVHAEDRSAPENERKQYNAARVLHDTWYRALHHAAFGTFKLQSPTWETSKKEARLGATLRVIGVVGTPICDYDEAELTSADKVEADIPTHHAENLDDGGLEQAETVTTREPAP